MDIEPENQYISLDTLENYIEQHPEDAEKWLKFLDNTPESTYPLRRSRTRDEINPEVLKANVETTQASDTPINTFQEGCMHCKKSWASTEGVPQIKLICGHSYHTVCYMYDHFKNDFPRCIVEECTIDSWEYIRAMYTARRKKRDDVHNVLLESYRGRADFKSDLAALNKCIGEVTKHSSGVEKLLKNGRRELIHKHLHSINYIQEDMNETIKIIKNSEERLNFKLAVSKFRKMASKIFRKYHVSFRELYQRRMVRCGWEVRRVLERHATFRYYRLGCRICPGGKKWKDPLA